jgi:hypothetical protein
VLIVADIADFANDLVQERIDQASRRAAPPSPKVRPIPFCSVKPVTIRFRKPVAWLTGLLAMRQLPISGI